MVRKFEIGYCDFINDKIIIFWVIILSSDLIKLINIFSRRELKQWISGSTPNRTALFSFHWHKVNQSAAVARIDQSEICENLERWAFWWELGYFYFDKFYISFLWHCFYTFILLSFHFNAIRLMNWILKTLQTLKFTKTIKIF